MSRKPIPFRLVGAAAIMMLVAACGGGGDNGSSSSSSNSPTQSSSGAVLGVASTSLGEVLVDAQGHTVYMLTADSAMHSSCSSECLEYWPPVAGPASGKVPSISGVSAKLGVTKATDGKSMLTANGWPLYTFASDAAPGDVTGEGVKSFGGVWYALTPAGEPIKSAPSSSDTDTGGGGYSY